MSEIQAVSERTTLDAFFAAHDFRARTTAFRVIAEYLLSLNRPVAIIETGTIRPPREGGAEWEDGQSTLLWDFIAESTGGQCISMDNDPVNVAHAKERVGSNTQIAEGESIGLLSRLTGSPIDLLYLDSMDFNDDCRMESALHHAGELAAAWDKLAPGGVVAVDDCHGPYVGKHALVKAFFEMLCGQYPFLISYVTCWRKP